MQVDRRTFMGGAVVAGVAATSAARAETRSDGGGRAHSRALGALSHYMDQHCMDWGLPGMTACVVDSDGFTGYATSGFANIESRERVGANHLFQIGSISKMMTALAVWSLIEEGKLSPDALLKDMLPEVPVRGGEAITLRHLLNHTSGLPSGPPLFVEGGLWTGFAPGERWYYSNRGYGLIGLIAAAADERPYTEVVEARVLKPLAMNASVCGLKESDRERYATGYQPSPLDGAYPRPAPMATAPWVNSDDAAGCIAATGADMALFLRFLLGLAAGKGGPVFSDATAKRFLANPAPAPGWDESAAYGNGVAHVKIDDRDYLHHTGGMVSFSSSLHVDPEAGVAAFASSNVHYGLGYRPRNVTILGCELLRAAQQQNAPAPKAPPTAPSLEKPQTYTGVFTAEDGDVIEIVAEDAAIRMRRKGAVNELQQAGENFFATRASGFDVCGLHFIFEDDKPARLWAGAVEYLADPAADYTAQSPEDIAAPAGRYESDDRWDGPTHVYARGGELWMLDWTGGLAKLTPLDNNEWRPSEESWLPERVRFDGVIAGRPQRMLVSGSPFIRRLS